MIKKIPLPLIGDKTTLYRSNSGYKVVLAALSQEEEDEIDKFHGNYGFYRYSKDGIVIAERDNIISYGEFNPDMPYIKKILNLSEAKTTSKETEM